MQDDVFLEELDSLLATRLAALAEEASRGGETQDAPIAKLLELALRKELEASEEAAMWMTSEPDVEVKLALARQCGDEAKHYRLIEERLRSLGVDTRSLSPLADGYTPMFRYLASLETTVERVAAGPYAREALAKSLNEAFIGYCESHGDSATASLYREQIQPDEEHHHRLGRTLLARLAKTPEDRERARRAATRTLEIAEELSQIVRLRRGIACAPGC
jgi:1,2-phenylacetyl-CoA epoxidase catalytic subunit